MTLVSRLRGRRLQRSAIAVIAVVVLTVVLFGSTSAYVGTNPFVVTFAATRNTSCDTNTVITATVRDAHTGKPVDFQTVRWSFRSTLTSRDRLSASSTTTNSAGHTSVTVSFGPAGGTRRVIASVGGFANITSVGCGGAVATQTPKPRKTPPPTPKPPKTATQQPALYSTPTPERTLKPKKHHQATPTPVDVSSASAAPSFPSETAGAGDAILELPTPLAALGTGEDLAVVGGAAATAQPAAAAAVTDSGGGGGFGSFGMIALLVIGALLVLVVIFLVRQPARARARR